ncbi:MAG: hypothetical protein ABIK28_03145 [Planctomycetota bacterium]
MPIETFVKTGKPEFDGFYPRIRSFLEQDILDVVIDGKAIRGFRTPDARSIWIRDHSDMLRGGRYFEHDLTSAVEHFADTQAANGRIFDYFTTFPEKLPCERENWTKYVRVPVEADVEFRFVKGAHLAWQATGDDAWIRKMMPNMKKALDYSFSHPWRWDEATGLVKRAYTIDTWDFAYTAGVHEWLQFQINDDTYFGIMHGDNSGFYEACIIMSKLCSLFETADEAERWKIRAEALKANMNRVCWNGSFYTHFVKLIDVTIPGVDESAQLSLSNPMDINRGVADHDRAVSIIEEYQKRGRRGTAFAEWFSIDPPFPDGIFGDEKLKKGAYVNGGIMPLVGGELARAAFEHGFEEYGVQILRRYHEMISAKGETYLWYFPDGAHSTVETSTSPDAMPTDGWGSSAMLYAFIEGLAGIRDEHKRFEKATLSPRWPAAGVDYAEVRAGYVCSGASLHYLYECRQDHIYLKVTSPPQELPVHLLLPDEAQAANVQVNGSDYDFSTSKLRSSSYVDFKVSNMKTVDIKVQIKRN